MENTSYWLSKVLDGDVGRRKTGGAGKEQQEGPPRHGNGNIWSLGSVDATTVLLTVC